MCLFSELSILHNLDESRMKFPSNQNYRQTSNISRSLVGNDIVDHADVIGASPVRAAPTTSSFSINTWLQWTGQRQLQDETRNL